MLVDREQSKCVALDEVLGRRLLRCHEVRHFHHGQRPDAAMQELSAAGHAHRSA